MIDRDRVKELTELIGSQTQRAIRLDGYDSAAATILAIADPIEMVCVVTALCRDLLSPSEITWLQRALVRASRVRDGDQPTEVSR